MPVIKPEFVDSKLSATWLGEGTLVVKLDEVCFITDPEWWEGDGKKFIRYNKPPCEIDELPKVYFFNVLVVILYLVRLCTYFRLY